MFGIDFSPDGLLSFFSQFIYEPNKVYSFVVVFMMMSSIGFPVPEELVLISSALVAYLALDPVTYPPPFPGAPAVEMYTLMSVCFFAVLLSDTMVFCIGKFLGQRMLRNAWIQKKMGGGTYATILKWFDKYGAWCCGIFRFTPGLRFPGHIACGMMVPMWKFLVIDILAAALSVPTQVWLVGTYGKQIIATIKEFQIIFVVVVAVIFVVWWLRRRALEKKSVAS